ncbi:hypothetical protein BC834DRAFT_644386 [Gloeopeniophorella convolvens]|nr:hypothetical protein BC834DRAFT_644386 [Gloeopeniophorella convolvens]
MRPDPARRHCRWSPSDQLSVESRDGRGQVMWVAGGTLARGMTSERVRCLACARSGVRPAPPSTSPKLPHDINARGEPARHGHSSLPNRAMGCIVSCIAGIFACIGDCVIGIIACIADCLECIIAAITGCITGIFDCICDCLCCGARGSRRPPRAAV